MLFENKILVSLKCIFETKEIVIYLQNFIDMEGDAIEKRF